MNILAKNVQDLIEKERISLIKKAKVDEQVLGYLQIRLTDLQINVLGMYKGKVLDLMSKGLLEGYCWETTESSIVFFKNDDYIERGILKLSPWTREYWHSWICFNFNNKTWVFDPCLKIIADKSIYYHVFEISKVEGSVTAKAVKEDLISRIKNRKVKIYNNGSFLTKILLENVSNEQKNETHIIGNDDVNSPMYRNNTGYTATIKNGEIIRLKAHYYMNG